MGLGLTNPVPAAGEAVRGGGLLIEEDPAAFAEAVPALGVAVFSFC